MSKPIGRSVFLRRVLWAERPQQRPGDAFVALQTVTVLAFVELRFIGLRRACAIVPV